MKLRRDRSRALAIAVLALVTLALVACSLLRPRAAAARLTPDAQETYAVTASSTAGAQSTQPTAASTSATSNRPSTTPTPTRPAGGLVVLGDDYAKGADWVQTLGQQLGMSVTNLAEDGEGYRSVPRTCSQAPCQNFASAAAKLPALDPQVVVIEGGEADGDFALDSDAQATLQAVTKAVPNAKVLVVSPLSDQFPRPYWVTLHTQAVQKAATSNGAVYVDVSALSATSSSYDNSGSLTPQASAALESALVKAAH